MLKYKLMLVNEKQVRISLLIVYVCISQEKNKNKL